METNLGDMGGRGKELPRGTLAVIEACTGLNDLEKRVWVKLWRLRDGGNGCRAKVTTLAEWLGTAPRNVERALAGLTAAGLLQTIPGNHISFRHCRFLTDAVPNSPRPKLDELQRCRVLLDDFIATRHKWRTPPATSGGSIHSESMTQREPTQSHTPAINGGRDTEGVPARKDTEGTLRIRKTDTASSSTGNDPTRMGKVLEGPGYREFKQSLERWRTDYPQATGTDGDVPV